MPRGRSSNLSTRMANLRWNRFHPSERAGGELPPADRPRRLPPLIAMSAKNNNKMNASPQLIRKLSFDSTSSIEFDCKDEVVPEVNRAFFKPTAGNNAGTFKCLLCDGEPGHTKCLVCKGKGTVGKGSPFMCFLDAVLEFKRGNRPALPVSG